AIHRNYVPRHKKGGSVSAYTLAREAPAIVALYHAPALVGFLSAVSGQPLRPCPESDPHACALYFYTEPGDHIGFHYDTSYYRGARFTVLVGLIERSSSRLVCQPFKGDPTREPRELRLATEPGTLVFFNGDRLWHAVTPLGEGEERVSLTLEYVTDPTMSPVKRFVSNMKDAIAYFGFRTVFGGGRATPPSS
ncbi:MAG TPA: 2OG-Fe(II) oxygenase, partial [Thermodesulfobacteriota bacterium]